MHLCVQTLPFEEPLEETLEFLHQLGVETVDWRCDPDEYLGDADAQADLLATFDAHDIGIDMLGATGHNPLHPDDDLAAEADALLRQTIRLADQLDVDVVSSFSGLPGGTPDDRSPNWIVSPVPTGNQAEYYRYQWEDVAIPYWTDLGAFADDYGIDVAIEIHTNMLVNSPTNMMRLREATSDRIGAYVDPGHLWLQEIDPVASIRYLADHDALVHFETSDVVRYDSQLALKGLCDMTPMADRRERPWSFCAVGYGHSRDTWREIISTLDLVGYDGPVSIQQLNTPEPLHGGVEKSASLLTDLMF